MAGSPTRDCAVAHLTDRSHVDTIIIFRIGSLGDTVVALPCFHHIARVFPDARRLVVTDVPASRKAASVESILGKSGLVNGFIDFPPPPRKIHHFLQLRKQIRATNPRMLIYIADRDLPRTLRDVCFFRLCGIKHIIGTPVVRDLRFPRTDPKTGEVEREALRLARCLAPLGTIEVDNSRSWDLRLQSDEIAIADERLAPLRGRRFAAINLGGKVASKDWGYENWSALLRLMMIRHSSLALVFVGSADEFDRSAELAAIWPGPTLNLCGYLAPRESAAAMKRALFFLGHDSGPMHLAAASGVPCIGLFGNFNMPKWWHPIGEMHHIIHKMQGVRAISTNEVHSAICAIIARSMGQVSDLRMNARGHSFLPAE
jgi:ADP-heptose:LPS heptosyltransferase